MISCDGCVRKYTYFCKTCVGWNKYESNILVNPVLDINIDKELKMLRKHCLNEIFGANNVYEEREKENMLKIKKVIFNTPVTVVLWEDGTKTIVKSGEGDIYDPEKGLAMAIAKKALGNKGNYYEVFKKWLPSEEDLDIIEKLKQNFESATKSFRNLSFNIPKVTLATDVKVVEKDGGVEVSAKPIKYISAEELAEKLGVTKVTIQKKCRQGKYPGTVKVGGKWKIPC